MMESERVREAERAFFEDYKAILLGPPDRLDGTCPFDGCSEASDPCLSWGACRYCTNWIEFYASKEGLRMVSLGDLYASNCCVCWKRALYGIASTKGPEGCKEAVRYGRVFCWEHFPASVALMEREKITAELKEFAERAGIEKDVESEELKGESDVDR